SASGPGPRGYVQGGSDRKNLNERQDTARPEQRGVLLVLFGTVRYCSYWDSQLAEKQKISMQTPWVFS
ncbi:MAG: hypothetical protein ACJA1Q_003206, partial [Pseudohongiellaceae bacterium]